VSFHPSARTGTRGRHGDSESEGIETEYGITVKNQPDFNPILSSLLLINTGQYL